MSEQQSKTKTYSVYFHVEKSIKSSHWRGWNQRTFKKWLKTYSIIKIVFLPSIDKSIGGLMIAALVLSVKFNTNHLWTNVRPHNLLLKKRFVLFVLYQEFYFKCLANVLHIPAKNCTAFQVYNGYIVHIIVVYF